MHIKGHWYPSGLEVEEEYKKHNSAFSLVFFFNCIIFVQILTMLKILFTYDALKNDFYP